MKNILHSEITFTKKMFDDLRAHLLADRDIEQAAFALAAPNASNRTLRLLAHEIIHLSPRDFEQQSGIFLSVKPERSKDILRRCLDEGWSLIEIHSHPFSEGNVAYSYIDIDNEKQKFAYVAEKIPNIYHATMVFGQNDLDAHIFDRDTQTVKNVDQINIIDAPIQTIIPVSAAKTRLPESDLEHFERQIKAFGTSGQEALSQIRVGIVGLGGVGSHLAQQLAHLGVQDFLLIDHDCVETTNLNRLVGATDKDVAKKALKVEVAKRLIHQINANARVKQQPLNISESKAIDALKGVDFIFGASDNDGCRLLLNRISVQYLIPYLDIGTGIETSDGKITALGGQIRLVLPGHGFCLNCNNSIDRVQAGLDLMTSEQVQLRQTLGYGLGPSTPAPSVIFLNGTLASLAIGELLNLLTGYKASISYLLVDLMKPSMFAVQAERRADCVTCSTKGNLATGDLESIQNRSTTSKKMPVPGKHK